MRRLAVAVLSMFVGFTALLAQDVLVYSVENKTKSITPASIEAVFVKHGFTVSDNRDMNEPYKKQFGETSFDVYNLFTPYHMDVVEKLIGTYPNIGLFSPMSLAIWMKKGDSKLYVSTLSAAAMAKITGIEQGNAELIELEKKVRNAIAEAMPGAVSETVAYEVQKTDKELVTSYTFEIDADEWEDAKDEFMMLFEGELDPNGFVVAGFNDIQYILDERGIDSGYDFYDVESICKLPVIYTVSKSRPEAGAFAPCSLYMYKKKGEGVVNIAFPNVYNWISSLSIDDQKSIDELEDAQRRMVEILESVTE